MGAIDVGRIEVVVLGHGASVVLGGGTVVTPGGRVVGGKVVGANDVLVVGQGPTPPPGSMQS